MKKLFSVSICLLGSLAGGTSAAQAAAPVTDDFKKSFEPLLSQYCYDCHADGVDKGDFTLDDYSNLDEHLANRELWLRVWDNLRSHLMPPADKDQPNDEERVQLASWIEKNVFKLDPANPDPGRVTIRRMNRQEYRYTILDLLGIDFNVKDALPPDDTGYGFDTIGDVLSISPMLMEKYLDAASKIVASTVRPQESKLPVVNLSAENFKAAPPLKKTAQWLPFDQPVEVKRKQVFEHAGEYQLTVEYKTQGSAEATSHAATLALRVNDVEVATETLGWDNRSSIKFSAKAKLVEGDNVFSLVTTETEKPLEGEKPLNLVVASVAVTGPLDGRVKVYPKEYYRVFHKGGPPKEAAEREAYARDILRRFADRAFRRPVDEPTLDRLVKLYGIAAKEPNAAFENAVGYAVTAILASPRFLFRAETQPEPDNPGKVVPIDEFALASRLSYFLWSSLPDAELFELAQKGQLRANLNDQIDRMLEDSKSQRFIENFVGQWLMTRDVEGINIDPRRILGFKNQEDGFRVFGRQQREAMKKETEMLVAHLVKENRSALELFTADYSFLNEPLAKFYGIEDVKGNQMRKVSLPKESKRGGILTHGSLLVVTSNPTRTSPVKRGLFVLENLLDTPAPPAPPDVPTLEEVKKEAGKKKMTMRETMVIHREKALCASCHARMDDLGLALENFNAIGMYRAEEEGQPIDTAGQLITGETFSTVAELNQILATSRRADFYRCITSKLLTFALGRGMEYYDSPSIDQITANLEKSGGKMRTLIYGVVNSTPFQKRRGDGAH
jgi:mono/diheme cytochrome c family protein